ncbi:MAG: class I SAM-dependent methyltransferase [Spirulina sp. SIO3F2]|nr:class I SAM-dependent methyltransferase [Spirulina sp. SIO3F2]
MDLVLYDPEHGYYSQHQTAIGSRGDFFTSVSLGADFGELLAVQLVQMWEILGCPQPFEVVEMGAGDGDLARDILNYLNQNAPDVSTQIRYLIIERAPGKLAQQQAKLQDYPVQWLTWDKLELDSLQGCCLANELVDAFPVHRVVVREGQLQEIYVTVQDGQLQETVGMLSTEAIATYFSDLNLDLSTYPEGYCTEVNLAAIAWLETVASKLRQGYLLTIDYGYSSDRYYHPQRHQGTLQAYYQHRRHNDPYVNLGQQDLTAHVNFTALEQYGQNVGLEKLGFTQQGLFLMALGLGDRLNDLSSGAYDIQTVFKRRDALHQLIDPAGLGNFGVLVQGKGLNDEQQQASLQGFKMPAF